jgi:hypothetical protein
MCDSAVSVVTVSRSDDWCFIPEKQDLSFTSIFRLALDIGRILRKSKEKKTVVIYIYRVLHEYQILRMSLASQ